MYAYLKSNKIKSEEPLSKARYVRALDHNIYSCNLCSSRSLQCKSDAIKLKSCVSSIHQSHTSLYLKHTKACGLQIYRENEKGQYSPVGTRTPFSCWITSQFRY